MYRYLVHGITVHAGKTFAKFLLTRLRFANPNRSTTLSDERTMRNVSEIAGYDAPRSAPYADTTHTRPPLRRTRSY